MLAGVSAARRRRRPRSISPTAGYKTANIPIVVESPPPPIALSRCRHPLVVGLTTSADRLIQVRRNRLLSLNQAPETAYVEQEAVTREIAYARRMFADNGWPVIDVTRRSIEETAAAIIALCQRAPRRRGCETMIADPRLAERLAPRDADAAGVPFERRSRACRRGCRQGVARATCRPRDLADALAELKALKVSQREPGALVLGSATRVVALDDGTLLDKPASRERGRRASARGCRGRRHDLWSAAVIAEGGRAGVAPCRGARSCTSGRCPTASSSRISMREWPAIAGCVGCFRIEGPGVQLFDRIEGSQFTVLGLPLLPVLGYLRERGVSVMRR